MQIKLITVFVDAVIQNSCDQPIQRVYTLNKNFDLINIQTLFLPACPKNSLEKKFGRSSKETMYLYVEFQNFIYFFYKKNLN